MHKLIDFSQIVQLAWEEYDSSRKIKSIEDISAKVSTNHVYMIRFEDEGVIIAKLSYFGKFDHFKSDHTIINALANNLPKPFENFLAKSLTKYGELFTYRYTDSILDAWVVFYNPIQIDLRPERKQTKDHITVLGKELAKFHKACRTVKNTLPLEYKQTGNDVNLLLEILETENGQFEHRGHVDDIRRQCDLFYENCDKIGIAHLESIPVFVDWNIGNFSVTKDYTFFSRWDYDWFRMSTRVMDFYFFSRVCSSIGDRTVFSYLLDPLMEERFALFLKSYHSIYPLTRQEVLLIKEAYRFFILNYVIKDGRYFFHEVYAGRLQQEAHELYFPQLDAAFNEDKLLKTLDL
ncbi:hypothetical protein FNH22_07100 [Fulvivirga sp. M361]|uniref:hypothetical protein n=1 Tax=Fulvivirga sp. M361 TaxID=2594266 RepID=UPI00117AC513|nr:hypothetical protein [Fulvivirga sp. M361]TRX60801.1 hypothetical protein FNH22_07100 [Fulvivirga sp. M361]